MNVRKWPIDTKVTNKQIFDNIFQSETKLKMHICRIHVKNPACGYMVFNCCTAILSNPKRWCIYIQNNNYQKARAALLRNSMLALNLMFDIVLKKMKYAFYSALNLFILLLSERIKIIPLCIINYPYPRICKNTTCKSISTTPKY